jgi:hypothetical protein
MRASLAFRLKAFQSPERNSITTVIRDSDHSLRWRESSRLPMMQARIEGEAPPP